MMLEAFGDGAGEGGARSRLILLGEQPGDKEDLAGKPFVGPAGRILDAALAEAGIRRSDTFVTNAVKHFKYEQRGKRRLHKRPNTYEIERCHGWLEQERAILKPAAIVALGGTAARSLFRRVITIVQAARGGPNGSPMAQRPSSPCTRPICSGSPTRPTSSANIRLCRRPAPGRPGLVASRGLIFRALRHSSSRNRPLTKVVSASSASAACGPLASIVM
jgi:uracil-DNA glycosylase family 4